MASTAPPLPFAPLRAAALLRWRPLSAESGEALGDVGKVAQVLDVPPTTIYRYEREGTVPFFSAARYADELGLHVLLLWEDAYADLADADVQGEAFAA